jgi:hypothetical protein
MNELKHLLIVKILKMADVPVPVFAFTPASFGNG